MQKFINFIKMGNNKDQAMKNNQEEEKNPNQELVDQHEVPLTEQEANTDFTNMTALDLGTDDKYKTKLV